MAVSLYTDHSTWVWVQGVALKENGGSSVAEGAVDHVRVSSNPADVCHTGKDVSGVIVEYILDETQKVNISSHTSKWKGSSEFYSIQYLSVSTYLLCH